MSNNQDPIIVTVNQEKGGVGKSFIAFNFSNYLAVEHDKKVLVIDTDFQCNISEIFSVYDQENTFANILTGKGDVKVHSVRPNIDLIGGNKNLDPIQESIATERDKEMKLYMWLADNFDTLNLVQYDFIIIDTHNDFGTATKNAVAVSDMLIAPITPSTLSSDASIKWNLEDFKQGAIDYRTRESLIKADLKLVANLIRPTKNGKEFEEYVDENPEYIAKFKLYDDYDKTVQERKSLSEKYKGTHNKKILKFKQPFDENMEAIYQAALNSVVS
ncbi:ParA family protein [Mammaliicoccus lentus]|uniref:ParA family protein n=1 Tax=Mammaliicoccus lentus TaxID=42858 RepID=UPI00107204D2|nr:ParA family protein [Mammaliicoccus lentus]MBF0795247.1 ParA family protein [Mammaliicoccus lentus]TFV14643.1 ParA family protein [Mammaliicoccus lentus]